MPTITTKNQTQQRAQKTVKEEGLNAVSGKSSATSSSGSELGLSQQPSSGSPGPETLDTGPEVWTKKDDGTYDGPGGAKHWGDKYPKVMLSSRLAVEQALKEVDNTAQIEGAVVRSQKDTVDTYIAEVAPGKWVVSGPLARMIAQAKGLTEMTSGEGNPPVTPQTPHLAPGPGQSGVADVQPTSAQVEEAEMAKKPFPNKDEPKGDPPTQVEVGKQEQKPAEPPKPGEEGKKDDKTGSSGDNNSSSG